MSNWPDWELLIQPLHLLSARDLATFKIYMIIMKRYSLICHQPVFISRSDWETSWWILQYLRFVQCHQGCTVTDERSHGDPICCSMKKDLSGDAFLIIEFLPDLTELLRFLPQRWRLLSEAVAGMKTPHFKAALRSWCLVLQKRNQWLHLFQDMHNERPT